MAGVVLPYIMGDTLPGNLGDARLNRFLLEHFYAVLVGQADSFTNPPLFYPWTDAIAFSDTHWGTGLIYGLFRLLGFAPARAFAGWFAVGFALNYVSAYTVFRLFGLRGLGAAAGAFLFSFGLPITAQDGHAQLFYRFCVPWAVWTLCRYLDTRDGRLLALLALLVACQLLISFYIGTFLVFLLAAYTLVIVLQRRPFASEAARSGALRSLTPVLPRGREPALTAAGLALVAAVVLVVVAVPYLEAEYVYHLRRRWIEISTMLPRPSSYLKAVRSHLWSWLSAHLHPVPMAHEHQMFFGLVPVVCLGIALVSRRLRAADSLTRQSLYALGILVLLTLNLKGYSLYALLAWLPGLSAIRAVTRIVLVMLFPVALITGRLLDLGWEARLQRPYLGAVVLGASLFLVFEAALVDRNTSTVSDWRRVEALRAESGALIGADSILVVSDERTPFDPIREIDAMLLAQAVKAKTLNGYSGSYPPGWVAMRSCADIVSVVQAGERFRQLHGEPGFQVDIARLVPIGFGDCSDAFAKMERSRTAAGK